MIHIQYIVGVNIIDLGCSSEQMTSRYMLLKRKIRLCDVKVYKPVHGMHVVLHYCGMQLIVLMCTYTCKIS